MNDYLDIPTLLQQYHSSEGLHRILSGMLEHYPQLREFQKV